VIRYPLAVLAVTVAVVAVLALLEWRDHRRARRAALPAPRNAVTVVRHPAGDVITGAPRDIREVLLERCREMDAAPRGGAR
jgi:hypothetical protein